jgi:hypothetical protein
VTITAPANNVKKERTRNPWTLVIGENTGFPLWGGKKADTASQPKIAAMENRARNKQEATKTATKTARTKWEMDCKHLLKIANTYWFVS